MNIVILSNQSFSQELKTNKWHVATRLAKLGHKVVFVDPPLRLKALRNTFTKKDCSVDFYGVRVLTLFRPSPQKDISKTFPVLDWLFTKYTAWKIKILAGKNIVLWVYHVGYPDLELLIKQIKPTKLIYDMVDEYTEFPEYAKVKDWLHQREQWLLEKANLCFTSAVSLYEKAKKINQNSYYTPNAGDFELFSKPQNSTPEDLRNIPHPIVGFAGALDDFKIDILLVAKCAQELPAVSFVLIGPQKVSQNSQFDSTALLKYKNIYLLGQKRFVDLPAYYQNFDAYFIPYDPKNYTSFPVKFFEALSCGLPTIVTALKSYFNYKDQCYIAKDHNEFVKLIVKSLKEDNKEKREARILLAKNNSWDNKVKNQLEIIQKGIQKGVRPKKKPNVVIALNSGEQLGGVERQVGDIVKGLAKDFNFTVVCKGGSMVKEYQASGANFVELYPRLDFDPLYVFKLLKLVKPLNPIALHAHELKAGFNAMLAGFLAGTPARIYHVHTPITYWQLPKWKKPILFKLNLVANKIAGNFLATKVIALTKSIKIERVEKEGINPSKIEIVPNGIGIKVYPKSPTALRIHWKIPREAFVIGNIGRLTVEKGHEVLIRAFSKILQKNNNAYLVLAGDGNLRESLEGLCRKLNISSKVRFLGSFKNDQKYQILTSFDLFVSPSLAEGFGISIIEAMNAEVPVLASNLPVFKDVGKDTINYFERGDSDDLAQKILNFKYNEKKIKEAYDLVAKIYSMEKFLDSYKKLYSVLG
ncbi:MAG: glycosyltransferase [Patescibacteria group bacterium]